MKKNRILIAGVITAFVALITLSLVSGTWAKYTSKVQGSDTARVAKWSFDGANLETKTIAFNLFQTSYGETVKSKDGKKVVAPGTEGSVTFALKNTGEVAAEAKIVLTITNANNIPVKITYAGVGEEETTVDAKGTIELPVQQLAIEQTTATEITIKWSWPFYGNDTTDTTDTTLGSAGVAEINVVADVTFTQVD